MQTRSHISLINLISDDEFFDRAYMVLLVAKAEPRMLIISDNEESQLGNIYRRAKQLDCESINIEVNFSRT